MIDKRSELRLDLPSARIIEIVTIAGCVQRLNGVVHDERALDLHVECLPFLFELPFVVNPIIVDTYTQTIVRKQVVGMFWTAHFLKVFWSTDDYEPNGSKQFYRDHILGKNV